MQLLGKTIGNDLDTTARVRVQIALATTVGRESIKNARRDGSRVNLIGSRLNNIAMHSMLEDSGLVGKSYCTSVSTMIFLPDLDSTYRNTHVDSPLNEVTVH